MIKKGYYRVYGYILIWEDGGSDIIIEISRQRAKFKLAEFCINNWPSYEEEEAAPPADWKHNLDLTISTYYDDSDSETAEFFTKLLRIPKLQRLESNNKVPKKRKLSDKAKLEEKAIQEYLDS